MQSHARAAHGYFPTTASMDIFGLELKDSFLLVPSVQTAHMRRRQRHCPSSVPASKGLGVWEERLHDGA